MFLKSPVLLLFSQIRFLKIPQEKKNKMFFCFYASILIEKSALDFMLICTSRNLVRTGQLVLFSNDRNISGLDEPCIPTSLSQYGSATVLLRVFSNQAASHDKKV